MADFWIACTDGSGYKEGLSVSAAVIFPPGVQNGKGVFSLKNEANAYRAEVEAILLCYEYVAKTALRASRGMNRHGGENSPDRASLLVYSDCQPAVTAVNSGFHGCSDDFEPYSLRLMCARKYVSGKCVEVPRNVLRPQAWCHEIASGLRVVTKKFVEEKTGIPVKFLNQ